MNEKKEEKQEKKSDANQNNIGSIRIADEVVSNIAGLAAFEVEGVAGMSGGITGGLTGALGRKNFTKGVKVEVGEEEVILDVYIIVDFGVRIPDVAWEVQENVKKSIEKMTGLKVSKVNIHVQGMLLPSKKVSDESEEEEAEVPE